MGVPQFVTSSKLIKTLMMKGMFMYSIIKVFIKLLLVTKAVPLFKVSAGDSGFEC